MSTAHCGLSNGQAVQIMVTGYWPGPLRWVLLATLNRQGPGDPKDGVVVCGQSWLQVQGVALRRWDGVSSASRLVMAW